MTNDRAKLRYETDGMEIGSTALFTGQKEIDSLAYLTLHAYLRTILPT